MVESKERGKETLTKQGRKEVVFITGTSSGFGMLTALHLAKQGYLVIASMRDINRNGDLLREAERENVLSNLKLVCLDVTNEQQVEQAVAHVIQEYGTIDILINNAGYALGGYIEEVPLAQWKEQFETNLFGLIKLTQTVLPIMREKRKGKIINISSISGLISFPSLAPYAASKFAVEAFSETLRLEVQPYGIHVSLIEPGSFQTGIWGKGLQEIEQKRSANASAKESANGTTHKSAYEQEMNRLIARTKKTSDTAPHPKPVIETIAKVVRSKKPRLRYPVGKGVRMTSWAKRLLPWSWLEKIILRSISKESN